MPAQEKAKKLKFKDKLVQKGVQTSELLRRLKALHDELAEMDQETVDKTSLSAVAKQLLDKSILLHKDKAVKALAACGFVDLLRLYAPEAPYTAHELKDIFTFIFRQLQSLWKPPKGTKQSEVPNYNQYYYLVNSMADVSSVVLVCDVPSPDDLIIEIFRNFFDGIRPDTSGRLEGYMADILSQIIDECIILPQDVLEILLAQFHENNIKLNPAAHQLAVAVCNKTSERLQRNVCQYFTDTIMQISHSSPTEEEIEDVESAHKLIRAIHQSAPGLLLSVIPQLEAELTFDDVTLRLMATKTLGEMFADKPTGQKAGGELARGYPQTWKALLGRKVDKAVQVRVALVEVSKQILANHPQLGNDLNELLKVKLIDPDEKVRAATCRLFSEIDYETAMHHTHLDLLQALAERCKDRKHSVRAEAFKALGRLFDLAYPEIESHDGAAIQQFGWIPQAIIAPVAIALDRETASIRVLVEETVAQQIVPLPSRADDEAAWVDRLLTVLAGMADIGPILNMARLSPSAHQLFERFVKASENYNGGVIDENEKEVTDKLNQITRALAASFPDPSKALGDLQTFYKANEVRTYRMLRTIMDPQTDLKTLIKTNAELVRRVEQISSSIVDTFKTFIRRCSYPLINRSSVSALVKRLQRTDGTDDAESMAARAKTILEAIAKWSPHMFRSHVHELAKAIADDKNERLVEVCLRALASVARVDASAAPTDRRAVERAKHYVLEGTALQAKFATRLLAHTPDGDDVLREIIETIAEGITDAEGDVLAARTSVLAETAKSAREVFESQAEVIVPFVQKDLLHRTDEKTAGEEEWLEDGEIDSLTKAKVSGLQVLTARALAHKDEETAPDTAKPVSQLLLRLLEHEGAFEADSGWSNGVRTRLRLKAGTCLLKLAAHQPYDREVIGREINKIALVVQDELPQVRHAFVTKLTRYLSIGRLGYRWQILPFVAANDPDKEIKNLARSYVVSLSRRMPQQQRLAAFELGFLRLLHLIAHHPDFDATEPEEVRMSAAYIYFYLECIATPENITLLFHLAGKLKTVRDADSPAMSENLYAVSDLAQHITKAVANARKWPLGSYAGSVKMPSDIFRQLPSAEAQREIQKRSFLKNDVLEALKTSSKPKPARSSPKCKAKADADGEKPTKTRKRPAAKSLSKPRRKKRAAKAESSDEDVSEASGTEDEDMDAESAAASSESEEAELDEDGEEKLGRGGRRKAARRAAKAVTKKKRPQPRPAVKSNGAKAKSPPADSDEMDED